MQTKGLSYFQSQHAVSMDPVLFLDQRLNWTRLFPAGCSLAAPGCSPAVPTRACCWMSPAPPSSALASVLLNVLHDISMGFCQMGFLFSQSDPPFRSANCKIESFRFTGPGIANATGAKNAQLLLGIAKFDLHQQLRHPLCFRRPHRLGAFGVFPS